MTALIDYRSVPLFNGLSRVEIARLVPELEDVALAADDVLVRQGDPGDALFIVAAGHVRAELEGPDGVTALETIGPGNVVGEVALLSGGRRTATVRAVSAARVWRLSRQKLDSLMLNDPAFALHFNHLLGSRLANVSRHLSETKSSVATFSKTVWEGLPRAMQDLVARAAPLHSVTPSMLDALADGSTPQSLQDLKRLGVVDDADDERCIVTTPIRAHAEAHFRKQHGADGYRAWARTLAERCDRSRDFGNAVEAFLQAGAADAAARVLLEHDEEVLSRWGGAQTARWVERVVPTGMTAPRLWRFGGRCAESAGWDDIATSFYDTALKTAEDTGNHAEVAHVAGALAALYERRGAMELARRYTSLASSALVPKEAPTRRMFDPRLRRRQGGAALGAAVFLATWLALPLLGAPPATAKVMAIVGAAVVFWILDVVPEFVTALLACVALVTWGVAPPRVALSGFASPSLFLLLVIFGLSSLVTRSGLTFRAALLSMNLFPRTYRGQAWALACSGIVATTLIPSINGRLTMVGPLTLAIKDTLRVPDHSRGAAGLALAAYVGYGQMSFLFMNGTAACFVIAGLMPPAVAAKINWGTWLLSALPLGVVVFTGSVLTVLWRFRPAQDVTMDPRVLAAQLRTMGRVEYQERLSLLALVSLLSIFVLEPLHKIEPAWLALGMVAVLFVLGADRNMFRSVDYQYLLYFGAFVSLAAITRWSGADTALLGLVQPHLGALKASPYLLLGALCVASYVMTALVPGLPTQPVLMIASIPVAERLGYDPFVFGLVLLATMNPGITPALGTLHQAFRIATEQRAVTFGHFRELAVFRVALTLLGVLVSIPFWRLLGMVP